MSSYIDSLKRFIHKEYDAGNKEISELWSKSIPDRVALGEAITNLSVVGQQYRSLTLQCSTNLSKFRAGDRLVLSRGNPRQEPSYKCVLEQDQDTFLQVQEGFNATFDGRISGGGWTLDRQMIDIRHLVLGAADQLMDNSPHSNQILSILQGRELPQFRQLPEAMISSVFQKAGFNSSQREAFWKALTTENYYLIQGPPGTGKTYLLAWLAITLAEMGQKVLITAFTHRAINNALRKVDQVSDYKKIAKIGQNIQGRDLMWESGIVPNYEYANRCPFAFDDSGFILGGTCFAVRGNRLKEIDFDTVIFDEAGQMPISLAAAGMLAGKRYIFIGDHKQMAPIVQAEHQEEWVSKSIFESLFQGAPGTMLDETFRMNEGVNRYPSQRFYGGGISPSEEARHRTLILSGTPGRFGEFLKPEPSDIFIAISHPGDGMRSKEEAATAAGIVQEAISRGLNEKEIAVVAPYRAQVRLIRNALLEMNINVSGDGVVVDTVERIQGQERDVIIFSLTTSDPGHAASRAEFYFQPNRLNVAITRPRVKRIVIGDPTLFTARAKSDKHNRWIEHFSALYEDSTVYRL